jgi:NAD+ kinase
MTEKSERERVVKSDPTLQQPYTVKTEDQSHPIRVVGLLQHPKILRSQQLCQEIGQYLEQKGYKVYRSSTWEDAEVHSWINELDLLITLGGDGTILKAARMAFHSGTPILGVNLGRLGFLSELTPENWRETVLSVLEGHYWIESRLMLQTKFWRSATLMGTYEALNDAVVSRGSLARTVRLDAYVENEFFTTYKADGVILATPTGSTAYALAVGGPILPPQLKNLLLIPIAPHLSMDRAIVLSSDAQVDIKVSTDHSAILTIDGQFEVTLKDGDVISASAAPVESHFVRTQNQTYFYRTLMERLK